MSITEWYTYKRAQLFRVLNVELADVPELPDEQPKMFFVLDVLSSASSM